MEPYRFRAVKPCGHSADNALCRAAGRSTALNREVRFAWVPEVFLVKHGVTPWTELPLWVPPHATGLLAIDISKAQRAGLTFRPLADTIRDTFQWIAQREPETSAATRPASGESTLAGLAPARERALLQHWHTQQ